MILLTPGPTEIPGESIEAMSRKAHHRTSEFRKAFTSVVENLHWLFKTKNDILVFASSGTGAMEASVVNLFSPGDRVLICSNGKFGKRFAEITKSYGLNVDIYAEGWGKAINPEMVNEMLKKDTKAVFLTHNETSTGVANDVKAVGRIVKENGSLFIVDTISGLGVMEFETDRWGVDVAVSGSQKGLMAPPGLSFVSLSEDAWESHRHARLPKYYFSFDSYKEKLETGQTPFTPAIPLIFSLEKSLDFIKKSGLENLFKKYSALADMTRERILKMGLELFAERPSSALTSVRSPQNISSRDIVEHMKRKGIVIAGGQGQFKETIFRIAHMGYIERKHIEMCMDALSSVIQNLV